MLQFFFQLCRQYCSDLSKKKKTKNVQKAAAKTVTVAIHNYISEMARPDINKKKLSTLSQTNQGGGSSLRPGFYHSKTHTLVNQGEGEV